MQKSKRKGEGYASLNLITVVTCLIVVALILLAVFSGKIFAPDEDDDSSPAQSSSESSEDLSESFPGAESSGEQSVPVHRFIDKKVNSSLSISGSLILVNNDHAYELAAVSELINIYSNKKSSYKCGDTDGRILPEAQTAFNDMMEAFYTATESNAVTVLNGFLTGAQADAKYNTASNKDLVAKGGTNDFESVW